MKSVTVNVSPTGRLHLPAGVRRALGLTRPGQVVITVDDGEVRLSSAAQALERARALARPYAPKGGRLASEELIAERRAEARREEDGG